MRSMDLPRRSFGQLSDQRFQGSPPDRFDGPVPRQPENCRVWPPVARDGRARSPEELLDNLRRSLGDLKARYTIAQRTGDAPSDWDAPPDYDAYLDWNVVHGGDEQPDRDVPYDHHTPYDHGPYDHTPYDDLVGHNDGQDLGSRARDVTDRGGGIWDGLRAARELNDAFPGLAAAGPASELDLFADHGHEEPYRPWFMSGDPSTPWWAADDMG